VSLKLTCDPQHERAVSIALERAAVTVLMVTAALCVGFLYAYHILTYARRLAIIIRAAVQ
jgi:hypothetical protein